MLGKGLFAFGIQEWNNAQYFRNLVERLRSKVLLCSASAISRRLWVYR
jgi:hypothetical protein